MTLDELIAETVDTAVREAIVDVLADKEPAPLVLSADEAARLLSVSRRTVEAWVADGVLPRMPNTGRLLIPRAAVEAWVAGVAE